LSGPTIRDIAREANVGTATVERVLNDRGGVRTELAERVIKAAKKLKYGDRRLTPHRGIIRIEVLLVQPEADFFLCRPQRGFPADFGVAGPNHFSAPDNRA